MIIGDFTSVIETNQEKWIGLAHLHSCLLARRDFDTVNSECFFIAGNKRIKETRKRKSSGSFSEIAK